MQEKYPIEIRPEQTFYFILVLSLFSISTYWISKSILYSIGVAFLLFVIFLFNRKRGIVFTENQIERNKVFHRQDVYKYNQLLQVKAAKLFYTNFARFAFQFTFESEGKKIILKYFMSSNSLGRQIIKLLKEKNVEIIYDDEIIEQALTAEQ